MFKWIEEHKYWCTACAALLPSAFVIGWITSEADGYRNLVKGISKNLNTTTVENVVEEVVEEVVA